MSDKIPDNWNNVTLGAWAAVQATIGEKTPDDLKARIAHRRNQAAVLLGIEDEDEARRLPIQEMQKIERLLRSDMPKKLHKRFILNGIRYEVITKPHLLPSGEMEELVADAMILKTGQVVSALSTKGDPRRWHQIIFNLCRPIKRKWRKLTIFKLINIPVYYRWEAYEFDRTEIRHRIADFKNLRIEVANPIAAFFLRLSKEYGNYIPDYLDSRMETMNKMIQKSDEDLRDVGDGT